MLCHGLFSDRIVVFCDRCFDLSFELFKYLLAVVVPVKNVDVVHSPAKPSEHRWLQNISVTGSRLFKVCIAHAAYAQNIFVFVVRADDADIYLVF